MADESRARSLKSRWNEYRPTKAVWFWSCAGTAAAVLIAGFASGAMVLGGKAEEMATAAARDARAEVVASICVANFMAGPGVEARLTDLKETATWRRTRFIEDGSWAQVAGLDGSVAGASRLCAERLMGMSPPAGELPASEASANDASAS